MRRVQMKTADMLVALTLATYADYDGSRVRPGTDRLMAVTGMSKATILRALSSLREMGLIERVAERYKQGRNGGADEYRLTFPLNFGAIPMLDPDEKRVSPVTLVPPPEPVDNPSERVSPMTLEHQNGCHLEPERVSPMTPHQYKTNP